VSVLSDALKLQVADRVEEPPEGVSLLTLEYLDA
jgi:hypothetical protein